MLANAWIHFGIRQLIDQAIPFLRILILEEFANPVGRGQEPGEVQKHSSQELRVGAEPGVRDLVPFHLAEDEIVDETCFEGWDRWKARAWTAAGHSPYWFPRLKLYALNLWDPVGAGSNPFLRDAPERRLRLQETATWIRDRSYSLAAEGSGFFQATIIPSSPTRFNRIRRCIGIAIGFISNHVRRGARPCALPPERSPPCEEKR